MTADVGPHGDARSTGRPTARPTARPAAHALTAVVFDFTGVLTQPLRQILAVMVAEAGYDPSAIGDLFRPMFASAEDGDAPWHRLERGEVTMAQFLDGLEPAVRPMATNLFDPASPFFALGRMPMHDGMFAFAGEVRRAGFRTAILTNDAREWRAAWDAVLGRAEAFEHVVRSSEIGLRKPDPRAYRYVLDLLGVDASAALFLDDFEPMVAGARHVGMQAVHVVDHDTAIAEARELLGLRPGPR